ncbi:hypothetical protein H6F77_11620 [Microcoleus sp. FACHB-831]|uniref:hypothetical protein n=1 Tax=Microcoleus sp. FACHB-831 TaxID=2692827 RepID=UPI0016825696|nr:hypothetical protein [Microcoleus sp. FACHB-831]MBD1921740.1 hypothetical protein [Microcoleus sp. FACHB-831]
MSDITKLTDSKAKDICSVGSGHGFNKYKGQKAEAARRKVLNAVEAKERCNAINVTLKADKVSCKLDIKGESLTLRFSAALRDATDKPTHEGGNTKQWNVGCGLYADDEGFSKGEFYCRQISQQMRLRLFTWEWFDKEIKGISETPKQIEKPKTIGDLIEEFKNHYLSEGRKNKHPESNWKNTYLHYYKPFNFSEFLSEKELTKAIESTEPNTASRYWAYYAIQKFLDFHQLLDAYRVLLKRYKKSIDYKHKELDIRSDDEYEQFILSLAPTKRIHNRFTKVICEWRWTFGMLLTYGLRPHEALNILNLYEPYKYEGKVFKALNDPTNDTNIIVTDGKTGMRTAMPLSPEGKDWVALFELKTPMPRQMECGNPLHVAKAFGQFLRRRGFTFKSYSLRHRWNHRARERGIDTSTAALSMGHSEMMNSTTYKRQMGGNTKAKIIEKALEKLEQRETEKETIETLRLENELLRTQNNLLEARNRELERRLAVLVEDIE